MVLGGPAGQAVERVARRCRGADGLAWMYGQGSVITGFSADSDLDFVAVWHRMPTGPVLSAAGGRITRSGELAVEQLEIGGYEVEVQHVPVATYDRWMAALQEGEGWSGDAWPMPVHVAAGLAEGLVVADASGSGAELRARLQTPEPVLVRAVVDELSTSSSGFLRAMRRASSRGDLWLHDLLAVRLHKLVYSAWFLVEGHHPPFPKHLPDWFERYEMDGRIRRVEAAYWATSELAERDGRLHELASAVLDLRR